MFQCIFRTGTGNGSKIKTGPGPIIRTRNYWDQDQSSGPEMTAIGTGPVLKKKKTAKTVIKKIPGEKLFTINQ